MQNALASDVSNSMLSGLVLLIIWRLVFSIFVVEKVKAKGTSYWMVLSFSFFPTGCWER